MSKSRLDPGPIQFYRTFVTLPGFESDARTLISRINRPDKIGLSKLKDPDDHDIFELFLIGVSGSQHSLTGGTPYILRILRENYDEIQAMVSKGEQSSALKDQIDKLNEDIVRSLDDLEETIYKILDEWQNGWYV